MEIIDKADEEKKDIDERLADTGSSEGARAKLLAVTSCPTGIAHTYMAAEGLEKMCIRDRLYMESMLWIN